MNEITSHAIIIHSDKSGRNVDVVAHDILKTRNGFTLGAGRAFGINEQTALVSILSGSNDHKPHFISNNILCNHRELLIWWKPEHDGEMVVKIGSKFERIKFKYPALVFIATSEELRVGTVGHNKRPDEDDYLYYAPVMCQSSDLSICEGNMTIPKNPSTQNIGKYEEFFFEGAGTHYSFATLKGIEEEEDFISYIKTLIGKKLPRKMLVRSHYSISGLIRGHQ